MMKAAAMIMCFADPLIRWSFFNTPYQKFADRAYRSTWIATLNYSSTQFEAHSAENSFACQPWLDRDLAIQLGRVTHILHVYKLFGYNLL